MSTQELAFPRRVLIVKPSALGDVVTALPVLRGLKRTFPDAKIDWLVTPTCAGLIAEDPDLDRIVLFERKKLGAFYHSRKSFRALRKLLKTLRSAQYDWVIDLQGLLRSGLLSRATRAPIRAGFANAREGAWMLYNRRIHSDIEMHTVDRNIALARELGIDANPEDMTLHVPETAHRDAKRLLQESRIETDYLVCVPPTTWETKLYPVRHWRSVIDRLRGRIRIVLLGAPGDVDLCQNVAADFDDVVSLAGKTNVSQMCAVIAQSRGVICCDSAAKFIAPAVGIEAISLIGPTRENRTGPYLRGSAVIAPTPCQGCLRKRCCHITCMELIDPADVASATEKILANDQ